MELLGLAEIATLFSVTKQVIANWRARKASFPTPIAELKSGPVWKKLDLLEWASGEGIEVVDEESPRKNEKNKPTRQAKAVAFMNMKGGVGKSTLTVNIGWFFAYTKNCRVLLVDLDPQFNLSQYVLGVKGYEKLLDDKGLTVEDIFKDVKGGERPASIKPLIRSAVNYRDGSCVHIIPANLELAWTMKSALDRAHVLRDYVDEIRKSYDLILFDCSPTESTLSTAAYLAVDYIFIPVRPEFLSTIGLPLLARSMKEFEKNYKNEPPPEIGGIIFNDTSEKVEHDRSREYVRSFAAQHDIYVFKSEVSHSDSYPAGARIGRPIFLTDNARSWKKDELASVAQEFAGRIGL